MTKRTAQAKATQKVYTLLYNWNGSFSPRFSFHAADDEDAKGKVAEWARYQGLDCRSMDFRLATENEAKHWLHDEWVD